MARFLCTVVDLLRSIACVVMSVWLCNMKRLTQKLKLEPHKLQKPPPYLPAYLTERNRNPSKWRGIAGSSYQRKVVVKARSQSLAPVKSTRRSSKQSLSAMSLQDFFLCLVSSFALMHNHHLSFSSYINFISCVNGGTLATLSPSHAVRSRKDHRHQ